MTRLHPIPAHPPRPAADTHTARKAHPISPEIVDPTPTPSSADVFPHVRGALQALTDIPTQLALGSDGRLYIAAEKLPEPVRRGRRIFTGVALTPDEAALATKAIEDASPEITQTIWRMLVRSNPAQ